jgi:hypothetical protein
MNSTDQNWLSQLAPAHAPADVSWWPLAVGWWVLMVFGIVLIIAAYMYFNRRKFKLQSAAIREIEDIKRTENDREFAEKLAKLLRRYAITVFKKQDVAKLQGEGWLNFIVLHGGLEFSGASGQQFLKLVYGGQAKANREGWLNAAKKFIKGT